MVRDIIQLTMGIILIIIGVTIVILARKLRRHY